MIQVAVGLLTLHGIIGEGPATVIQSFLIFIGFYLPSRKFLNKRLARLCGKEADIEGEVRCVGYRRTRPTTQQHPSMPVARSLSLFFTSTITTATPTTIEPPING